MKYFAMDEVGVDDKTFKAGLLTSISEALGTSTKRILIGVPLLSDLPQAVIGKMMGRPALTMLLAGKEVNFQGVYFSVRALDSQDKTNDCRLVYAISITPEAMKNFWKMAPKAEISIFLAATLDELQKWKSLKSPYLIDGKALMQNLSDQERKDAGHPKDYYW